MNTEGWMAWKMSTVVAPILSRINRAHSTNHEEDNLILGKWRNLGARLHGWNNEWPISIITLFLASDLESIVKKSSSALLDIFSKFFASWEELWCSKNLKLPYPNWGVKTIFYWAWHVSLIGGWSYGKKKLRTELYCTITVFGNDQKSLMFGNCPNPKIQIFSSVPKKWLDVV